MDRRRREGWTPAGSFYRRRPGVANPTHSPCQDPGPLRRRWIRATALGGRWAAGGVLAVLCGCGGLSAPPQPIAFSHAQHAKEEIGCERCHRGATTGDQAGLPAVAACAACHRRQIPDHPEIQKVMQHYENQEPILWRKVNVLPAHALVRFKHKPHSRAGVDCVVCHGDVAQMTVAAPVRDVADMGWCVECHRRTEASTDCLVCHH